MTQWLKWWLPKQKADTEHFPGRCSSLCSDYSSVCWSIKSSESRPHVSLRIDKFCRLEVLCGAAHGAQGSPRILQAKFVHLHLVGKKRQKTTHRYTWCCLNELGSPLAFLLSVCLLHLQGLLWHLGQTWTVRPGSSTWWWCRWRICWASVAATLPPPQSPSAWLMSTTTDPHSSTVSHMYSMSHSGANARPCTPRESMKADCEDMFDILPNRYLFDHSSPVQLGGFCTASAAFGRARPVIQKLKGDSGRKRGSEGEGERRWRRSVHLCVHTYMCRPPDEFNHSHAKGHLSWPLETNLAFWAINLTKWMPREEINSSEMRQQGWYFWLLMSHPHSPPVLLYPTDSVFCQKAS